MVQTTTLQEMNKLDKQLENIIERNFGFAWKSKSISEDVVSQIKKTILKEIMKKCPTEETGNPDPEDTVGQGVKYGWNDCWERYNQVIKDLLSPKQ